MLYFLLNKLLNMFRVTMCPSSGADDWLVFSPRVDIELWLQLVSISRHKLRGSSFRYYWLQGITKCGLGVYYIGTKTEFSWKSDGLKVDMDTRAQSNITVYFPKNLRNEKPKSGGRTNYSNCLLAVKKSCKGKFETGCWKNNGRMPLRTKQTGCQEQLKWKVKTDWRNNN